MKLPVRDFSFKTHMYMFKCVFRHSYSDKGIDSTEKNSDKEDVIIPLEHAGEMSSQSNGIFLFNRH